MNVKRVRCIYELAFGIPRAHCYYNLPSVALISELVLGKAQRFVVNKLSRQILGFSAPFCQPADINTQGVVGCTDQC